MKKLLIYIIINAIIKKVQKEKHSKINLTNNFEKIYKKQQEMYWLYENDMVR